MRRAWGSEMAQTRSSHGSAPHENEFVSGFPISVCDLVPSSKYLCCNCHNVLKMALQTLCGHRYCARCLTWILRNQSAVCLKCEEDPSSLTENSYLAKDKAFSDTAINTEISELRAHCDIAGCSWSGVLRDYENHNCGKPFSKDPGSRKLHLHSNSRIPHTGPDDCRFAPLDCTYRGSRDQLVAHEQSAAVAHVALVLPLLLQIQSAAAVTDNGYCDHNREVQKVPASFHNGDSAQKGITTDCATRNSRATETTLTARMCALETRIQVAENIIMVMNREIDVSSAKLSAALEEIEQQHRNEQSCEKKISDFHCTIARKDIEINELQAQIATLEQTSYDGIFLWKIANFKRKCQDASAGRTISLYSPAFFTARYGYKVCLRIYLNGDGNGKGSHISLFFAIMKSEYDVLLSWPFRHKVTFMLLDQSNREHIIDAFRPDSTSISFQRPVSDMNVASGCPLFCPLSKLQSTSSTYIQDDAMFIRCIIDSSP